MERIGLDVKSLFFKGQTNSLHERAIGSTQHIFLRMSAHVVSSRFFLFSNVFIVFFETHPTIFINCQLSIINIAIKRAQNQACLSFAERKQCLWNEVT